MAESTQIAQEIGAKIRYLRLKRGMSQETLALNCDMNPAFLGHVERGMRCPTVNTLQRICNGLDITLTELILTQSGEEQTPDDPRNASVQHVLDVMSHLTPTVGRRKCVIERPPRAGHARPLRAMARCRVAAGAGGYGIRPYGGHRAKRQ